VGGYKLKKLFTFNKGPFASHRNLSNSLQQDNRNYFINYISNDCQLKICSLSQRDIKEEKMIEIASTVSNTGISNSSYSMKDDSL